MNDSPTSKDYLPENDLEEIVLTGSGRLFPIGTIIIALNTLIRDYNKRKGGPAPQEEDPDTFTVEGGTNGPATFRIERHKPWCPANYCNCK